MKKYILINLLIALLSGSFSFNSFGQCMEGVFLEEVKNVSCFGGNDGEITVRVEAGKAPFYYELVAIRNGRLILIGSIEDSNERIVTFGIAHGNVSPSTGGIVAHNRYFVRVISSETVEVGPGCQEDRTYPDIAVTQPALLNPQVSQILPACNGNDGSIILDDESTFGGTAPYTYTWSNGLPAQKDQNGNLDPGTYSVTITDAKNCFTPISNLIVLPPPNATITAVDPVCAYVTPFNLLAVTSGGTWSGVGITDGDAGTFNPATAGPGYHEITYTVSLNGCTDSDTETIQVLSAPDPTIAAEGPFCIIDDAVTLVAATTGGTWSGTGITDPSAGTFNPATAGAGSHNISYSVTVDGCTSTDSETIVVHAMPDATITPSGPFCSDGGAVTLSAATAGGTWSGTGITDASAGTFNPITAGEGSHTITYTIDVNGCESSDTETIIVNRAPDATIAPAGPVCLNEAAFNLSAATTGGTWSGTGITNASMGTFNPATAGAGSHEITYEVTISGCTSTATETIIVNPMPDATITPAGPVCIDASAFNLSSATAGGTWSGTGITDASIGAFDPATAGIGSHLITYEVTVDGCTSSDTETIVVQPMPDATITAAGPVCSNDDAFNLSAATVGGTWSGTGIIDASAGTFNPATAGSGSYNITYEVTVNGCTSSDTETIVVNPAPDASITPAGPVCVDATAFNLSAATTGGTWSGTGITNAATGTFNPATAGAGSHEITYSITVDGCTSSDIEIIVVNPLPDASITPTGPFCSDGTAVNLVAATAGGTWSGTGITDASAGTFNPATAGAGSHEITYSITVNGCISSDIETIIVNPAPDATITVAGPLCNNDDPINLIAATTGGTWSGTGITDASAGTFDPATAGAGSHEITYSLTLNGCTSSDTETILVNPAPDATISAAGPVCIDAVAFDLTAATAGGTWSGTGITDASTGTFDPATAGVGSHEITYTVTIDACTNSDTEIIVVNPLPDATITAAGPLCANDNPITLTAATEGGTWSGIGITDADAGIFDPATARAGSHEITYSLTVSGCTSSDTETIVVNPAPDATISASGPFCISDDEVTLTAATAGGTWSGTGITDATAGSFDPATAGIGSHEITYSVTVDGCTSTYIEIIIVNPAPDATIAAVAPVCANEEAFNLSAATAGGTWSGTGITDASAGTFDPSTARAGSHEITYSMTVGGCTTSDTETIIVNPVPDATIVAVGPLCSNDDAITLTAATTGGIWSGTGITDAVAGTFNPATAGTGSHEITYSITVNGCASSAMEIIVVNPAPNATINPAGPVCVNAAAFNLTAATVGGEWSGTGITHVIAGTFDPVTAGAGSHNITYTVTVGGCTSSETEIIVVNPLPDATIIAAEPLCSNDDPITLTAATEGGTWSGMGITDVDAGIFDPETAGAGSHEITYSVTVNGCTNTDTETIIVNPAPDAAIAAAGPFCINDNEITLTAATAGGTWSGVGISDASAGTFDPATAGVGTHTISYTLTVAGCTSTDFVDITVNAIPVAQITYENGTICEGNTIQLRAAAVTGATYQWTYPDGTTSTERIHNISDVTAADGGIYRLIIRVNGCESAEATTEVIVNPRPANPAPTNSGPVCAGGNIQLFANVTGMQYEWRNSGGTIISTEENPVLENTTTADAGTYYLRVSANGQCFSAKGSTEVVINNSPAQPVAQNPNQICVDTPLPQLSAEGTDLRWYRNADLATPDGSGELFDPTPYIDNSVAGDHNFYVTQTTNGCTSPATTVTVSIIDGQPAPPVAEDVIVCINQTATLTAQGKEISWSVYGIDDWSNENTFDFPAVIVDTEFLVTQTVCGITSEPTSVWVRVIDATPQDRPAVILASAPTCTSAEVEWTAVSDASAYRWDLSTQSNFASFVHQNVANTELGEMLSGLNQGTTYFFRVRGENACGAGANSETLTFTLPSGSEIPVADSPAPLCVLQPIPELFASGTNVRWYSDAALTNPVATGNFFQPNATHINNTIEGTTSFYVIQTSGTCSASDARTVSITYSDGPKAPEVTGIPTAPLCLNQPVPALSATGTGVVWYRDLAFTDIAGTGNSFTPDIDNSKEEPHTFYVTQEDNCGRSEATEFTIFYENKPPLAPEVSESPAPICINEAVPTLTATGAGIRWYNADDERVFEGNSFVPDDIDNSITGTYTFYATQTTECGESVASEIVTVTFMNEPSCNTVNCPAITITVEENNSTNCDNSNSGSARVSASGGIEPYSYSWMLGGVEVYNGAEITDAIAGEYTVVVSDNNDCETTQIITIQPYFNVTYNVIPQSNCTSPNGSIEIIVEGGVGPYEYRWTGQAETENQVNDLSEGNYEVTIFDMGTDNYCSRTISGIPVGNICNGGGGPVSCGIFDWRFVFAHPDCGQDNGSVTFSDMLYDKQPATNIFYEIKEIDNPVWTGQSNRPDFGNRRAGSYDYRITNLTTGVSCRHTFTLDPKTIVTATASNFVDVSCYGEAKGRARIDASGSSTGNYYYSTDDGTSWTEFTPGNVVTNLPPNGTYNIRVGESENDACPAFVEVTINNINTQIAVQYAAIEASCNGNDGSITVTSVTGGVSGYEISLQGSDFEPFNGSRLFNNLDRGYKTLSIRDASGCVYSEQVLVPSPNQVVANVFKLSDPSCSGDGMDGSIRIVVDRNSTLVAPPYRYGISINSDDSDVVFYPLVRDNNDDYVAVVDNLGRGNTYYVYVVSSDNSCPTQIPVSFDNGPIAIDFDILDVENIACKGEFGSLTIGNVTRDTEVQFTIDIYRSGIIEPVFTRNMLNISTSAGYTLGEAEYEFAAGNYQIKITQIQSQCGTPMRSTLKDFTITEPLASLSGRVKNTEISLPDQPTGSIFIDQIRGGVWPYHSKIKLVAPAFQSQEVDREFTEVNRNENNQEYEVLYSNLYAGTYEVTIQDDNGCEIKFEVVLDFDQSLFIPNVFSPNGDGTNDAFFIRNLPETGTNIIITNRWGKTVYKAVDYQNNWTGGDLPDGVYFYTLISTGKKYSGWIELWRGPKY